MRTNFLGLTALLLLTSTRSNLIQYGEDAPTPIAPEATRPMGCDSLLYCEGKLLDTIQRSGIFKDSKTFVDMATVNPINEVLANFDALGDHPSNDTLLQFLHDNFHEPGFELKRVPLADFKEQVAFLDNVKNPVLQGWARILHNFWPELTRQIDLSNLCDGCQSSFLPTTHPFVVPGGRFREYYYWDSFFTMEGLRESELLGTMKHMILNFIDVVHARGFVPNGARVYYLNRSQPPMLTQMVRLYFEHTQDFDLLLAAMPALYREHEFWEKNRAVNVTGRDGKVHILNHYRVNVTEPRPEAYKEDILVADRVSLTDDDRRAQIYADLAAGAESGLDYTSRWAARKDLEEPEILATLQTHAIIPVELNSILYLNERDLTVLSYKAYLHSVKNHIFDPKNPNTILQLVQGALKYTRQAAERLEAMRAILWDPEIKKFKDYNLLTQKLVPDFSLTDFWPLWAMPDQMEESALVRHLEELRNLEAHFPGGLPATFYNTGLQWDFPNVWPPLQYMIIRGIQKSYDHLVHLYRDVKKQPLPKRIAVFKNVEVQLAQKYINNAFCAWWETGGTIP
ncbi:hypothetical protein IWQ60_006963, partial [Tieghemiomyces parasiticus]